MKTIFTILGTALVVGGIFATWWFGYIPGTKRMLVRKILANNKNNSSFTETKETLLRKSKADLQKMIDNDLAQLTNAQG